jgi:glutamate racemase
MKIGFFDSGLGGLTIMKAVSSQLPQYDYAYYGDTKNLPYGDKSEEEIYRLTKIGVEYLLQADCALVIIACNTASAETARKIQDEFLPAHYPDRKVLGIIVPTIESLVFDKFTKVALIGTKRTIESNKYLNELKNNKNNLVELIQISTPELVPLIELGEIAAAATQAISRVDQEAGDSEVVVLGCSHYTQIKNSLRLHYGSKKEILSQDEIIPNKLIDYLDRHPEISKLLTSEGTRTIHLTEHRPDYDHVMGQFLGGVFLVD